MHNEHKTKQKTKRGCKRRHTEIDLFPYGDLRPVAVAAVRHFKCKGNGFCTQIDGIDALFMALLLSTEDAIRFP